MSSVPVPLDVATEKHLQQRAGGLVWIPYRSGWRASDFRGPRLLRNRGVVGSGSAFLQERWHHLGGETLHALPGFAAADQHISDADCLQCLQSRDDLWGRAEDRMGL